MKVIETAQQFIGEKERANNGGFYNEKLQRLMSAAGHKKGEAWCCYFAEAMFAEAYPEKEKEIRQFFSGSCVQTFRNFRDGLKTKEGLIPSPFTVQMTPAPGALVLWQRYRDGDPTGLGHAGIVTEAVTGSIFKTIEGNTNRDGAREGDSVRPKTRSTVWNDTGLNVMGFIIIQ